MDIAALLATRGHLLLTSPHRQDIDQLVDLALQSDSHIGVADRNLPLLASLTVAENVALPGMYHRNLTPEQVAQRLDAPARAIGVEKAWDLLPANLAKRDMMRVKILRCLARDCGVLLLPMPAAKDVEAALEAIGAENVGVRLWVACLDKHAADYAAFGLNLVSLRTAS